MRLGPTRPARPQIPVFPLGSLSLLVLSAVVIAGMYAAPRGPGMRFASVDRDGRLRDVDAVRVEVLSEQESTVDGASVPFAGLAAAVSNRLAGRTDAAVVLVVSPEATYESMVTAYAAIAGLPGPPRIALLASKQGMRE